MRINAANGQRSTWPLFATTSIVPQPDPSAVTAEGEARVNQTSARIVAVAP